MLLATKGCLSEAQDGFVKALTHHQCLDWPHRYARTLLADGTTLRRACRRGDARSQFGTALPSLHRVGEFSGQTKCATRSPASQRRASVLLVILEPVQSVDSDAPQGRTCRSSTTVPPSKRSANQRRRVGGLAVPSSDTIMPLARKAGSPLPTSAGVGQPKHPVIPLIGMAAAVSTGQGA
jgi:hypothetical protein